MPQNPNPLEIDGSAIQTTLENLTDSIVSVLLTIIAGIFDVFLTYTENLLAGFYLGNPAVILITVAIVFTALMIWRRN